MARPTPGTIAATRIDVGGSPSVFGPRTHRQRKRRSRVGRSGDTPLPQSADIAADTSEVSSDETSGDEEGPVVLFVGPSRADRYWPRDREIGTIQQKRGDVYMVIWQWAGGPSAWPGEWLLHVSEESETIDRKP
jgi:hypothetical protein